MLLQALEEIPENAIIIEIGPHSQLFAQIERTVSQQCTITALILNFPNVSAPINLSNELNLQSKVLSSFLRLIVPYSKLNKNT